MQEERFIIKYISVNNCFLYLPDTWLRKLSSKPNVVRLTHKCIDYYLSWFLLPSPNVFPSLSATFARSLGIEEGDEIFITCESEPPSLTSITVIPKSIQDQEILEHQCDKIQSILLDQITVVARNQSIVVWVSKRLHVTILVDSLNPNFRYGKLFEHSEVHVKNATDKISTKFNKKSKISRDINSKSAMWSIFKYLPPIFSETNEISNEEHTSIDFQAELNKYINIGPPQAFRVHEMFKIEDISEANAFDVSLQCPYNVFIHKCHLPNDFHSSHENFYKIRKIKENRQYDETSSDFLRDNTQTVPKESNELIVKLFCLEDYLEQCSSLIDKEYFLVSPLHKCIYLTSNLKMNLKVKIGGKVLLKSYESEENKVTSIEIFPFNNNVTCDDFQNFVKQHSKYEKIVINSCAKIAFDNKKSCLLKINPECKYAYLNADCLMNLRIHISSIVKNDKGDINENLNNDGSWIKNITVRIFDDLLSKCELTLRLSLGLHNIKDLDYNRENILICGDTGSGKTTVCKLLANQIQKPPYFIHTHVIECMPLKGKKMEVIQKVIQSAMSDCVFHEYSVLILDDLDSITNAATNDEEMTPDSMNAARITDMIFNTLSQYQTIHYITLIATCSNINKLGSKFKIAKGVHFFRTIESIPILEKKDRIEILKVRVGDKMEVSGEINWNHYGNKTEGWLIQDLVDMSDKAAFTAWKRHVNDKLKSTITLFEEDLLDALNNSTPMSLEGINLYKGSGHTWSDIGGLTEIKQTLVEILQWPLKYPQIFKKAPIKLQSGVLLYGMPGTGKTLLASAIAKECGLNVISVKGPELLSKYIGASEESVRHVFEKAQKAKPCIIFFDEFDSLAPRRGHDSTGVTDRVVNQLLTQLDGVEGREGVAIVAATSRPDLLDPAILRPGRLDKLLLCPLPNEIEREEILKAICKSNRINIENLDLKELANLSTGFTGADLNAVLTQARLAVLEEAVEAASLEERKTIDDRKLTQKHLLNSLKSIDPSLTSAEKNKFNFIYSQFSKGGAFSGGTPWKQKATLA
ncbi:peroxisome biogenesis factor 1 [Leptopilina boulardi]|uniref:peroxisome biogenesis factor 1 n=1 Tax=Leptopilina boulardi TaxID=63433 RepID=UPI0021F60DDD|nr:peroxisome biogenesis factor 1 [Leptopilina boulardi]